MAFLVVWKSAGETGPARIPGPLICLTADPCGQSHGGTGRKSVSLPGSDTEPHFSTDPLDKEQGVLR